MAAGLGARAAPGSLLPGRVSAWLAPVGLVALVASIGLYAVNLGLHPHAVVSDIDLAVYRDAGLVARHSPGELYEWQRWPGLRFTYTPFAAGACALASMLPWGLLAAAMLAGSLAALLRTVWLAMTALGWDGPSRDGAAGAVGAVALWIEPVQRTLHSGEIDLLLMLLVVADLAGRARRWQGVGLGVAAGVKLLALIFIPYLLITRRYRQAGVAAAAFAATVAAGALLYPGASATWWLGGAFLDPGRTGFAGYLPNQSLLGALTRLAGTVLPGPAWLAVTALTGGLGLLLAAQAHQHGLPVHGLAICGLTGLLASPVSWDHHWVWMALMLAVLTDSALRARGRARAAWWALTALTAVIFGAWPSQWLGGGSSVPWGLIWYAPATPYDVGGTHPEYHWAGLQLLAGNLYTQSGLVLLAAVGVATSWNTRRARVSLRGAGKGVARADAGASDGGSVDLLATRTAPSPDRP